MTLREFRDLLLSVTDNVYHFEAFEESEDEYIIWQETNGRSAYGSNARTNTVKNVQVELYTQEEYTSTLDKLLEALEAEDIAFEEPVTDFNKDTKQIRHIIECEVI